MSVPRVSCTASCLFRANNVSHYNMTITSHHFIWWTHNHIDLSKITHSWFVCFFPTSFIPSMASLPARHNKDWRVLGGSPCWRPLFYSGDRLRADKTCTICSLGYIYQKLKFKLQMNNCGRAKTNNWVLLSPCSVGNASLKLPFFPPCIMTMSSIDMAPSPLLLH